MSQEERLKLYTRATADDASDRDIIAVIKDAQTRGTMVTPVDGVKKCKTTPTA